MDNITCNAAFAAAKPVWLEGRERERNVFAGFRAEFDGNAAADAVLRITGSSIFRVFLNGEFLGYGPARGPHGYARVDDWRLKGRCKQGRNIVAVEVAGYNVNSYYLLDQSAFLQAEVVAADGSVLACTGGAGSRAFAGKSLGHRVQKVQRYSFQRPFSEVYRMEPHSDAWRAGGDFAGERLALQAGLKLLGRGVPYPEFKVRIPVRERFAGTYQYRAEAPVFAERTIKDIGPKLGGFLEDDLEVIPFYDVQRFAVTEKKSIDRGLEGAESFAIGDGEFRLFEFGRNNAGFIGATIRCDAPVQLYFVFDEILTGDDVDITRYMCANVVKWELGNAGDYSLESFEPYELKYLKIMARGGTCEVSGIHMREYVNPSAERAAFESSDKALDDIFDAARETFKQNSVDLFTDCPGRERAGWLCDSLYIARVSADLCGNADMERAFLQNFLLPERFEHLPAGMQPMCYPSDHNDGMFIPNYAMWLVLQLEEYYRRSGDRQLVDDFKPRVMALVKFFGKYLNDDGLLEKLPSWVFVEWSKANELVQDVNYPSNMTYAAMLESTARLYGMPELQTQAKSMHETVRRQSFDGEYFVDNATRQPDGTLKSSGERTEVCQYYAFFCGTATPETHPELWEKMRRDFGPHRKIENKHPEIYFANAMIGQPMRLELLSRMGLSAQILEETRDYFRKMVEITGTLWEHDSPTASCSHGFASHVERLLYRDVLGIREIDYVGKKAAVSFSDVPLEHCAGSMPVGDGDIVVTWRKEGDVFRYGVEAPKSFMVTVDTSRIDGKFRKVEKRQ